MVFKKISMTIASFITVASVAACSSGNVPSSVGINGGADFKNSNLSQINLNKVVQSLNAQGEKPTVIDMGYKGGVSFAVKINTSSSNTFKTKANVEGHRFIGADVDRVKVFLFAAASFTTGAALTPAAGSEYTLTKDGSGIISVIFTNVPGNVDSWRVAVTSLTVDTAIGGSTGSPRNITKATGNYGTYVSENYAVSDTGGDSSTATSGSGNGSLLIDSTNLLFTNFNATTSISTTPLGITTTLIDAEGARIDSNNTITPGSSTPSGTLTAS